MSHESAERTAREIEARHGAWDRRYEQDWSTVSDAIDRRVYERLAGKSEYMERMYEAIHTYH